MKDYYITSVTELLMAGREPAAVLSGLTKTLVHRGHEKLHHAILIGVLNKFSAQEDELRARVQVASDESYHALKDRIEAALRTLDAPDNPQVSVKPNIVGGFIAEYNHHLINESYKERLLELYRNVTT